MESFWLVQVTIWDHARFRMSADRAESIECQVFGILYKETESAIYVCPWVSDNALLTSDSDAYVLEKHKKMKIKKIKKITGLRLEE